MRIQRAAILAVLALAAGACAALSPIAEKPDVTVRSVSLSSVGLTGMDGELDMDIYNPNGFGLPLTRVDYTLSVGTAQAVRGTFELSATIPAKGTAPVSGTFRIDTASAVGVAASVASGARNYEIAATLYFQTRFGEVAASVTHNGTLL